MGYFIKNDIAKESVSPTQISLSGNPNFIQFEKKKKSYKSQVQLEVWSNGMKWEVTSPISGGGYWTSIADFDVIELKTGKVYPFRGRPYLANTSEPNDMGTTTSYFRLGESKHTSAKYLHESLCENSFFKDKFDIELINYEPMPENESEDSYINIRSKEGGEDYAFNIREVGLEFQLFHRSGMPDWTYSEDMYADLKLTILGQYEDEVFDSEAKSTTVNLADFSITEANNGVKHSFKGTTSKKELNDNTFYLWTEVKDTDQRNIKIAESLLSCMLKDSYLRANFNIEQIFTGKGNEIELAPTIHLESKNAGEHYSISFESQYPFHYTSFMTVEGSGRSGSVDAISRGASDCEMQLYMYKDTGIFPGEENFPQNGEMGTYVMTLTKAYFGEPIWFNLNTLSQNKYSNKFLFVKNWCDTGTVQDFRFFAKRITQSTQTYENDIFYYSNVLYNVTGKIRDLEYNDLSDYVYNTKEDNYIRPLSNQPVLTHVKGQRQYFNFLLSDPYRNDDLGNDDFKLGLLYKVYSQSKAPLGEVVKQEQEHSKFNIANTVHIDLDTIIGSYTNVGYVEVSLARKGVAVSHPLCFRILPDSLYKVNDFAFLNTLGGWSSFNFPGTDSTDYKTSANTIFKTRTPTHEPMGQIEAVYSKNSEEQFTVQTMPVDKATADWLKELSASVAVYELSTNRYVVVDEFAIKPTSKEELFVFDMKYHYSDK